jgi:putative endopeptidase
MGDYYSSCLDQSALEDTSLKSSRAEFDKIDTLKNSVDLAEELAHIHSLGSDALFNVGADQELEDANPVIAYFDQSGLNLPEPGYYTSDDAENAKARAGHRAHLQTEFELIGESPERAQAAAGDVLKIEVALARAELTPVERRDRKLWYHEMTLVQLQELAPALAWKAYFAALQIDPRAVVNVAVPKSMQAVNTLLSTLPIDAWKDYLRWELVRVATPALPKRFREAEFAFYQHSLRGLKSKSSREQQCTDLTNRDLGEAVGREYVERYFPFSSKAQVLGMAEQVRTALRSDMEQAPWMSTRTRTEALRKLDMIRLMIGYPEHWRDYSHLTIRRGDALGNLFRAQEFEFRRQLAKIGRPVDGDEFYELPQSVEGYHDNPLNVVVFTAGILQPPFFDPQMDDAVNFGLAAAVMGHELSHAFDDSGHNFDGEGNMRNWWTAEDAAHYDERAACFVRQYSSYTIVDDVRVNGQLTRGENIADNGGLQLAHMAHASRPHSTAAIVGYTPEQRLFLAGAQWRCMNIIDERARELARNDAHSPGKFCVNGVVSNMPAFARACQCRKGDKMVNPEPCPNLVTAEARSAYPQPGLEPASDPPPESRIWGDP